MFTFLFLIYYFILTNWWILIMHLFLVPQIIHNAIRGQNCGFNPYYLFLFIGVRIIIPVKHIIYGNIIIMQAILPRMSLQSLPTNTKLCILHNLGFLHVFASKNYFIEIISLIFRFLWFICKKKLVQDFLSLHFACRQNTITLSTTLWI